MKNFIKFITVISIFLSVSCINVSQIDASETNMSDRIILSGTGTFDDPYILNGVDNEISRALHVQYLNSQYSKNRSGNYNIALSGKSYNVGNSGGRWVYKSGGNSLSYNGSCVYLHVDYIGASATDTIFNKMTDSGSKDVIIGAVGEVASYYGLKGALVKLGFSAAVSAGISSFVGAGFVGYSIASGLSTLANSTKFNILKEADSKNQGFVSISFKTSYNGSWYYHNEVDTWNTYPYAKEPAKSFGTGTFTSGYR